MNSNNVLLWQKGRHPFFIDFPFFQEQGHALQDLARLEAEVKFALMDRQLESPADKLLAFDHTHSQLKLWMHFEDCLIHTDWRVQKVLQHEPAYHDNVKHHHELVRFIRQQAEEVQRQPDSAVVRPKFEVEYFPALLFHTLRAISYDSLSLFKRLLAVYSASKLLTRLYHLSP
ncbi:MAG: hypothetical protein HOP19_10480 [Acidobacteria bacterium]|nr:hypothetical protein [Acidobacteriota bacterium]